MPIQAPVSVRLSLLPDPAEDRSATALTVMASTGLMDAIGDPARAPLRLPGAQLDLAAGLSAYTAMAALLLKPGGGAAHVSLGDVGHWLNWKNIVMAQLTGTAPSRSGRAAEWQTLRCKDGWIALVYRENDWPAVKRLLNDPEMEDPALNDRRERRRRGAWIAARAEAALAGMTRAEVTDFARRNRIPIGPVLSPEELRRDRQFLARGFLKDTPHGPMPRLPLLWNGAATAPGGGMA
ncbi:MAG: CoA transferase [Rhodobacteraceae bacterium]|nr:CoA transferase [Paracoccaceae bacterium]